MTESSKIGWTTHTFNPWWGCFKVSPGCQNCYAETFSKRTGHNIWGPPKTTSRRFFGDKHWREPLKWAQAAHALYEETGERTRVFCASMADVFEDHPDVGPHRDRLWETISAASSMDWLLLTKRPENIVDMLPIGWKRRLPPNIWLGTSVENQQAAEERIPHLLNAPAAVRFLSMEPLLGPVNLIPEWIGPEHSGGELWAKAYEILPPFIDWVIVGGESGAKHRPMDPDWLACIVQDCTEAGVPVYVKQDSGMYPGRQGRIPDELWLHQFPTARTEAPV